MVIHILSTVKNKICFGILVFTLALLPIPATAGLVYLVLSSEAGSYRQVAEGFDAVYSLSKSVPARVVYVDKVNWLELAQKVSPQDLIITVGTQAAKTILTDTSVKSGVLCVFLPRSAFESLRNSEDERAVSAIYLDQPFERQLKLSRVLLPKAGNVGVAFGTVSAKRRVELQTVVESLGLQLSSVDVGDGNFLRQIQPLLKGSDMLLALPDPQVNSPKRAKRLLYSAYKRKLPVFGFSKSYVTAGALAAVYSTPQQVGAHAAELAFRFLKSGQGILGAVMPVRYYTVELNESVARSLRIRIPEGLGRLTQKRDDSCSTC